MLYKQSLMLLSSGHRIELQGYGTGDIPSLKNAFIKVNGQTWTSKINKGFNIIVFDITSSGIHNRHSYVFNMYYSYSRRNLQVGRIIQFSLYLLLNY